MERVTSAGNVNVDGKLQFTDMPPTKVDAKWLNEAQEEIVRVIEAAGKVPTGDFFQCASAIVALATGYSLQPIYGASFQVLMSRANSNMTYRIGPTGATASAKADIDMSSLDGVPAGAAFAQITAYAYARYNSTGTSSCIATFKDANTNTITFAQVWAVANFTDAIEQKDGTQTMVTLNSDRVFSIAWEKSGTATNDTMELHALCTGYRL